MQRELRQARGLRRRRVQPPEHGAHRHRHRRLCEGRAGGAGRRGFSPARGCFCVAHLRPRRRKRKPLRAAAATTRLLGFAFGEVARPTRERTGEAAARIHTHGSQSDLAADQNRRPVPPPPPGLQRAAYHAAPPRGMWRLRFPSRTFFAIKDGKALYPSLDSWWARARRPPVASQPHTTRTSTGARKERDGAATTAAQPQRRAHISTPSSHASAGAAASRSPPARPRTQCRWRSRSCRTCGSASPTASARGAAPRSSGSAPRTSTPATR